MCQYFNCLGEMLCFSFVLSHNTSDTRLCGLFFDIDQFCGTSWVSCNSAQLQPHLSGETPGPTGEGLLPDLLSSEVLADPSSDSINSVGRLTDSGNQFSYRMTSV